MFPQHERGVAARLTDGIRAFLIDMHHGRAVAKRNGARGRRASRSTSIAPVISSAWRARNQ